MRVHFQQLTEPIARLVDDYLPDPRLLTVSVFPIPPPQLQSPSRLLQVRVCGDPS